MIMKKSTFRRAIAFALALTLSTMTPDFDGRAAVLRTPSADGIVVYGNGAAVIDASHTSDGYVMIRYTGGARRIKVRITKNTQYTYDLNVSGAYETFPLTEGSGAYTIAVFEQVEGSMYAQAVNQTVNVSLSNDKLPFLYPNQFCNYNAMSAVVGVSDSICAGITEPLQKVAAVYNYAVNNLSYDYNKAATVQSGYLPNIDSTLATRNGICFDYASMMVAMLRLQDIPSKLVIGYTNNQYHAWVSVYTDEQGWIDNVIFFNGNDWRFMDPTFASTGKGNPSVTEHIKNSANYSAKFTY